MTLNVQPYYLQIESLEQLRNMRMLSHERRACLATSSSNPLKYLYKLAHKLNMKAAKYDDIFKWCSLTEHLLTSWRQFQLLLRESSYSRSLVTSSTRGENVICLLPESLVPTSAYCGATCMFTLLFNPLCLSC
jgi:hypothetical protein